jgi:hypothetical protein
MSNELVNQDNTYITDRRHLYEIQNISLYIYNLVSGYPLPDSKFIDISYLKNVNKQELLSNLRSIREYKNLEQLGLEVMKILSHYPNNVDQNLYEMYLSDWIDDLSDIPLWAVQQACMKWRRNSVYKPKIVDIRSISTEYVSDFDSFFHFVNTFSTEENNLSQMDEEALNIRNIIIKNFGEQIFRCWFNNAVFKINNETVYIQIDTRFKERYIRENFQQDLFECISLYYKVKQIIITT